MYILLAYTNDGCWSRSCVLLITDYILTRLWAQITENKFYHEKTVQPGPTISQPKFTYVIAFTLQKWVFEDDRWSVTNTEKETI